MKRHPQHGIATFRATAISCLVMLAMLMPAAAQSTTPATVSPDREKADPQKLIDQLDDPDPDVRLSATLRVNGLGEGALEVAEATAKRDDLSPETRTRLQTALSFIRPRALCPSKTCSSFPVSGSHKRAVLSWLAEGSVAP